MSEQDDRWEQLEMTLQERYLQMELEVPQYHYCGVDRYWHKERIQDCESCSSHRRCLMDYEV